MTGRHTHERQGIKASAFEFGVFKDACRGGSCHAACEVGGGGAVHQMRFGIVST